MERQQALEDLDLIRRVLDMTRRRVDPQMFHLIIWGVIVLVWFPVMNWADITGRRDVQLPVSIVAVGVGSVASGFLGWWADRKPRLRASNTRLAAQCGFAVAVFVGAGLVLSFAIPALIPNLIVFIPHLWGLLYALMLCTFGIFYSREFFPFGLLVFAGVLAALAWVGYAGFILGVAMGIGCIVPGVISERRVSRMKREEVNEEL